MNEIIQSLRKLMGFQLLALCLGAGCVLFLENGAWVFVLFAEVIVTIICGVRLSNRLTDLTRQAYPEVRVWGKTYGARLMKKARERGDVQTVLALCLQRRAVLTGGLIPFALALLESLHSGF